jgi:predicted nucleic acid-binding protein
MNSAATHCVVVDSSVLINLIHVQALHLLAQLQPWSFVVPLEVVSEITRPDCLEALAHAIQEKWLQIAPLNQPAEFELLAEAQLRVELGESGCLALARSRGWFMACDEKKKFLPLARDWIGQERILGSLGLVVLMIRWQLISLAEVDTYLEIWSKNKFRVSISTFRELI